jgi:hypothetical protein
MNEATPANGALILLKLLWPGLVLLAVIMLGSVGLVLGIAVLGGNAPADVGKLIGEAHAISRLVLLLLVVPSLVVLTLLDKIDGPVTASALSAIAGYVLGGTSGGSNP